jgi:hypothetical protein
MPGYINPYIQLSKNGCTPFTVPCTKSYVFAAVPRGDRRLVVEMIGIEPMTSGLQSRRSPN